MCNADNFRVERGMKLERAIALVLYTALVLRSIKPIDSIWASRVLNCENNSSRSRFRTTSEIDERTKKNSLLTAQRL
jgi:hypothetical protein